MAKKSKDPGTKRERLNKEEAELKKELLAIKTEVDNKWKHCPAGGECATLDINLVTFSMPLNPMQLQKALQGIKCKNENTDEQLEYLINHFGLTAKATDKFAKVVRLFNDILQKSELGSLKPTLHLVGPAAANVAFYCSSIDMVITLESKVNHREYSKSTARLIEKTVDCILKRHFGVPFTDKGSFSFYSIFKAKNQHRIAASSYFYDCTIRASNYAYEVHQVRLLRLLTSYEPRFYRLVLLLLFWARQHRLVDCPRQPLTWYSFSLMIVYFLQNVSPPLLPPISSLQKFAKTPITIQQHNVAFLDDHKLLPASRNISSVHKLVTQFFNFYKSFNYSVDVISPRLGYLPKQPKSSSESHSEVKNASKRYAGICIEDPLMPDLVYGTTGKRSFEWDFFLLKLADYTELRPSTYVAQLCQSVNKTIARHNCIKQFVRCLQTGRCDILGEINHVDELVFLTVTIRNYFEELSRALEKADVDYRKLFENTEDYCFYGKAFTEFTEQSNLFSTEEVAQFGRLIEQYESLHPKAILEMRNVLLSNSTEAKLSNCKVQIDLETIGYTAIEPKKIFEKLLEIDSTQSQLECVIAEIALPEKARTKRNQFVDYLNDALQGSPFSLLQPRAHSFGSLANGLGFRDSDLDIFIQFDCNEDKAILDYETSCLVLTKLKDLMKNNMGFHKQAFSGADWFVPSRRCPIIKLQFAKCYRDDIPELLKQSTERQLQFNSCDISVSSSYGLYNSRLLYFLAQYEPRFYQMAMLLKYWAKQNDLVNSYRFSSYALTMLVIFFLQNCDPCILPSIDRLQQLAKTQSDNAAIYIGQYDFSFCNDIALIGSSSNDKSTLELIVDFFKYYQQFDYEKQAICPRSGVVTPKKVLYQRKAEQKLKHLFRESYICIEDPFLLEHNCGAIYQNTNRGKWKATINKVLDELNLNANNVVSVLCNPANFAIPELKEERQMKGDRNRRGKRFSNKKSFRKNKDRRNGK